MGPAMVLDCAGIWGSDGFITAMKFEWFMIRKLRQRSITPLHIICGMFIINQRVDKFSQYFCSNEVQNNSLSQPSLGLALNPTLLGLFSFVLSE